MKGINVSKHRQLKKLLHDMEQTVLQQKALDHVGIQAYQQQLDGLFAEYQFRLTALEQLIEQYEQTARHVRTHFFAKPLRQLLKHEFGHGEDTLRLVQAINALAK